eukprot:7498871-Pyramimonas_sp.AAC.1
MREVQPPRDGGGELASSTTPSRVSPRRRAAQENGERRGIGGGRRGREHGEHPRDHAEPSRSTRGQ